MQTKNCNIRIINWDKIPLILLFIFLISACKSNKNVVSNDEFELNQAILNADQAIIELLDKTYYIEKSLVIDKPITLRGTGNTTIVINELDNCGIRI